MLERGKKEEKYVIQISQHHHCCQTYWQPSTKAQKTRAEVIFFSHQTHLASSFLIKYTCFLEKEEQVTEPQRVCWHFLLLFLFPLFPLFLLPPPLSSWLFSWKCEVTFMYLQRDSYEAPGKETRGTERKREKKKKMPFVSKEKVRRAKRKRE